MSTNIQTEMEKILAKASSQTAREGLVCRTIVCEPISFFKEAGELLQSGMITIYLIDGEFLVRETRVLSNTLHRYSIINDGNERKFRGDVIDALSHFGLKY